MREILFRGKRIDNKEWVCGYYRRTCGCDLIVCGDGDDMYGVAVIPETVSQYIAFDDCDGNRIFEGDVVKAYLLGGEKTGYIRYTTDGFRFQFVGKYGIAYDFYNTAAFEIIGNIHDNPELVGL